MLIGLSPLVTVTLFPFEFIAAPDSPPLTPLSLVPLSPHSPPEFSPFTPGEPLLPCSPCSPVAITPNPSILTDPPSPPDFTVKP